MSHDLLMLDLILKRKFGKSTSIKEILFLFAAILVFPDVWLSYLSKKTLEEQQRMDIVIYAGATAGSLALTTFRVFLFFIVSLRSSQRLHDRMVKAILHTQPSFFDTNPTGRILNRFSRDIGTMDEQLPPIFISCIQDSLFTFSGVLVPAIANPWLLLIFFPTAVVFILLVRYYLKTSRELKRLESICRSPVFSHFSETMTGLETIRTRRMEKEFIDQFYRYVSSITIYESQGNPTLFLTTSWRDFKILFYYCHLFKS